MLGQVEACPRFYYVNQFVMIARILNKLKRLGYYYSHPFLWGKSIQINGIPKIGNPKKLVIGNHVSLNENCYIQCAGGGKIR